MTPDLHELYQEAVLDHNRRPRNFRAIEGAAQADGHNRLCGDRLTIYVRRAGEAVTDVSFQGSGCAICRASASLMTEHVQGMPVDDARATIDRVQQMLMTPFGRPVDDLGPLTALAGVRQFPTRVKCATLAWETLRAALDTRREVVSTE